jgi:hypothetical protein
MRVLIFDATGIVGQGRLLECLIDALVRDVLAVSLSTLREARAAKIVI